MVGSDENNLGVIRPRNNQVVSLRGGAVMGQNRRALRDINRNIIGVHPNPGAANKIGLSEKHGICKKNQPISGHRPVTRRFAAILANKQESIPEEIKKPSLSAPCSSQPLDCTITDVEDHEVISDVPAPMVVHDTKTMLEGNDQMDIVEEPVDDIDDADKKNQLAVVEYIEDIYAYYKKVESSGCVSPNYMNQQFDINERMRGILIDWLIEVHYKFELMDETLFLTVNLIDRFLAIQSVVRKKLQLVGVTAMLLACKYEEVSVPVVEDLILTADKAYTRKEVLEMEKVMLNTLQFNMSVPTSYVFMRRFLKAAQSDKKLELLSFFIIELCLVEYEMLKFPPSLLAASAIFTAQSTLKGSKQWNRTCEWHTSYSQKLLWGCSRLMVTFHQKSGSGKLTGVHRKYSTSKFGYAARSEPALFLLEESN